MEVLSKTDFYNTVGANEKQGFDENKVLREKILPVCARGFAACTAACATGTLLITAGGLPVSLYRVVLLLCRPGRCISSLRAGRTTYIFTGHICDP